MIRVDGKVKPHEFYKVLVLAESKLICKVETVVLVLLHRSNFPIFEDISVDLRGDGGKLGNQIHRVFKCVAPVVLLVHTFGISFGKCGLVLESSDSKGELSHWVEITRAAVDQFFNEFRNVRSSSPFCRQVADLLLTWYFTSQEEPEETCNMSISEVPD